MPRDKNSTLTILIVIALGGLAALVGNVPWLLIAAFPSCCVGTSI